MKPRSIDQMVCVSNDQEGLLKNIINQFKYYRIVHADAWLTNKGAAVKFLFSSGGTFPTYHSIILYPHACRTESNDSPNKNSRVNFFDRRKKQVQKDCKDCGNTGLDPHATVPKGIGVVCHTCGGRLLKKKFVKGITKVVLTVDGFESIDKKADLSGAVSYKEYWAGKRPTT